jgi:hypothetical protein
MSIDGNEVINSMRMASYVARAGCGGLPTTICMPCPELFSLVSTPPYIDPAQDDAPWFDPGRPESRMFFGVGGIDLLGVASDPDTNENGRNVRDVSARVVLAGFDESALSYGIAWLSRALKGSFCASGSCSGTQACIAISCPTSWAPDPVRTMYDVQVIDKPEVVAVYRMTGYTLWEVEFTLRANNPYLYQDPSPTNTLTIIPSGGIGRLIDLPAVYARCEEPVPCGQDPECPRPEIPIVPQPPLDACYPAAPFPGKRVVASVAPENVSTWLDMVPVVTITSADLPVRNLTVRFYVNALGLTCDDILQLEPCSACADITVSYLPPNSITEIDGRVRRALIRCISPSGEDTDVPPLYGPAGQMFVWPEFSCGYGLCVEVTAHESISPDATVQIGFYTRQEAA